ncbi:MAG TPA: UDP-3-O-acyl-N-acetylglucosamine deacetylase [Thermoguttaceae bacterium]|nr:UDP-3-O-acyl-N-acetylglucosamine deacetylase [Thermoguttaceae bacterium]
MNPTRNQRTIAAPAAVEGVGYWSGQDVRVEFRPAEPDSGIVFVRSDLPGCPRIAATVDNRTETPLRTTLRCGDARVDMVEHIMASLGGLRVDNCEVRVDRPEMPGCDGSALPFVEAIVAAGFVEQEMPRTRRVIRQIVRLGNSKAGDGQSWIEATPEASAETVLQYDLDYGPSSSIGRQTLRLVLTPDNFRENLAGSRTFLLEHEAAALQAQGLGLLATCQDLLVFGPEGPIDNPLRFADECVRHKLLDMVGDLALAGCDLIGCFHAHRSGHRLNAELVRALLAENESCRGWKRCA